MIRKVLHRNNSCRCCAFNVLSLLNFVPYRGPLPECRFRLYSVPVCLAHIFFRSILFNGCMHPGFPEPIIFIFTGLPPSEPHSGIRRSILRSIHRSAQRSINRSTERSIHRNLVSYSILAKLALELWRHSRDLWDAIFFRIPTKCGLETVWGRSLTSPLKETLPHVDWRGQGALSRESLPKSLGPRILENPYQMGLGGTLGTLWGSSLRTSLRNWFQRHSRDTQGPRLWENPYQLDSREARRGTVGPHLVQQTKKY